MNKKKKAGMFENCSVFVAELGKFSEELADIWKSLTERMVLIYTESRGYRPASTPAFLKLFQIQ
jgi:hypothetical protein